MDRGSLIFENSMSFLFRGGTNFMGYTVGKRVKNNTFCWFLARRTSTVFMKITAIGKMKHDVII